MIQAKPRGLILALDTAMGGCAVGIYDPQTQKTLSSLQEPMVTGQAERLVPMIEQVLENSGADYQDLAAVAVTRGPGAFTGLRIGLATAKGLSLALDIPAVGVETFEALMKTHRRTGAEQGRVAILIETKRTDYYACIYDEEGHPVAQGASQSMENVLKDFENHQNLTLAGDAVRRFVSEAKQNGLSQSWVITEIAMCDPAAVALCAFDKMSANPQERAIDTQPLYLRAPDVTMPAVSRKIVSQ